MMSRPSRIAVLHFAHETVTFLQSDTTIDDFTWPGSPAKGEALLAAMPNSYLGGFVKMAREFDGIELIGIESPLWSKRGTGSGWITTETFEHFLGIMLAEITAAGPFDGIYLGLHGAMAVRGVPRPEAEIARRIRGIVGPRAVLAATFDPHGNEDAEFLRHADMAFAVKYFPHYDDYLQGERTARTMVRAIRGDYTPCHVTRKVPIISPTVLQWTGASPWMDLVQRALVWEARAADAYVNVYFGFPWSDVPDIGMTIQVLTNGKLELAQLIADDMAATAWRLRHALLASATIHPIAEGIRLAHAALEAGETPIVLADHSDRSGAATWLLREIMAHDLPGTLVATIADADAIGAVLAAGGKVGDAFDAEIGGRIDPSAGAPIRIQGTIQRIGPGMHGDPRTHLSIGFGRGNVVVISPALVQVMEPDRLTEIDLDAAGFNAIAIKSRAHFRRGFDDTGFARTILLVEPDQPFLGTVKLDKLPYRNVDLSRYFPYGEPSFG